MVIISLFHYTNIWKGCADFDNYRDDFVIVKDYIMSVYPNEDKKLLEISGIKEKKLYDYDTKTYLNVPEEVLVSLNRICREGCPDKDTNLDTIRIRGDRISFEDLTNGRYALVYSPNEKPRWIHSPDENVKVKVKKIKSGWYHVIVDPG